MASRRAVSQRSFRVPRPTTVSSSSQLEIEETAPASSQAGLQAKKGQLRWTDDMDQVLIDTLLEIVLAGPRRVEKGFKAKDLLKVVPKVLQRCHVVVDVSNVRGRLKTLKKDCTDITKLFKTSGFGLDTMGRVTAEPIVWNTYFKENPNAKNLKGKLCPRYYDLVTIFGNDSATGDHAVARNDFPQMREDETNNPVDVGLGDEDEVEEAQPIHSSTSKRAAQGGVSKARRRRRQSMNDAALALTRIAQSSEKLAIGLEKQAATFEKQATQSHVNGQVLSNQSHVNGQVLLEKLRALGIDDEDTLDLMQVFEQDEKSGRFFLGINDDAFVRAWVYRKLGRDPPN